MIAGMVDTGQKRVKPVLTPPQGELPQKSTNPLVITLILVCLLTLLVLTGIVIWLLPSKAPRSLIQDTQVDTVVVNEKNDAGTTLLDPDDREAERLLSVWLKSLAEAEAENIQAWGGKEYAVILQSVDQGDQLFRSGEFSSAENAYEEAIDALKFLLASKEDKLWEAIEQGQQALEQGESEKSLLAFQQALFIDPDNEAALHGSERANNLDHVYSLYHEGLRLEKRNNFEQAQQLLREASRIDSDFIPAREALKRVDEKVQDLSFQDAMSRAITALDNGQIPVADKALEEAARLRPDDPSMVSARLRSKEMYKVQQLKSLQVKAEKLISEEDWEGVVSTYRTAIQIDDMVGFATIGLPEAEKRVQLDKLLKSIIGRPDRLQDDGPLREANQILKSAQRVENPGIILQSQIQTLSELVNNASTIVEVVFRSNSATEVEIYHVGRFRPFIERPIALKPGTYTVVGRRPGYKDVRLSITITADMKMPVFVIRCEEPI